MLASSALATALVSSLGYAKVSSIVRSALAEDRPFIDVVVERGLLREDEVLTVLESSTYNDEAKA